MPTYVALLRSVNVGGTGKLPMTDLKRLCEKCGFTDVRTYIASGNVVLDAKVSAAKVKATLEAALLKPMKKEVLVFVRTAAELAAAVAANPYPDCPPNRLIITFLDKEPSKAERDALKTWKIPGGERITLIGRELFVAYSEQGVGQSKLRAPFADIGTGRNLNTTNAMLKLARERE